MTGLLAKGALKLLEMSVRKNARTTLFGMEGKMASTMSILPVVCAVCFATFGYFAIRDPDPDDQIAGYVALAFVLAFLLILIHFVTFRVIADERAIHRNSLVTREKRIEFHEPFQLVLDPDQKHLSIKQNGTHMTLGWMMHGYPDFLQLVVRIHQSKNRGTVDEH